MRAGKSMACFLYAESYAEHPEKFMRKIGTIFTELKCGYGSEYPVPIAGDPSTTGEGDGD
jgi:hypothetical protein